MSGKGTEKCVKLSNSIISKTGPNLAQWYMKHEQMFIQVKRAKLPPGGNIDSVHTFNTVNNLSLHRKTDYKLQLVVRAHTAVEPGSWSINSDASLQ